MNDLITRVDLSDIQHYWDWQRYLGKAKLNILFVTDGTVASTNTVYEFMNNRTVGCTKYRVKRAAYADGNNALTIDDSPAANAPHFANFRFNSNKPGGGRVIDDFHVIYLFAVDSFGTIPDADLAALHEWMQAGGGIFATGDHSTLGVRLADKIPRVGTMRKWSNADGVPPGTGTTRIDTNQPDPNNAGQVNGTVEIPNNAQSDAYPQPIDWLAFTRTRISVFQEVVYPHEILCHPTLGPIDVMPDHPHEGECENPMTITMDANVNFATTAADTSEYPTHNGHQERPRIIARGRTSSQYKLAKDDVDPKIFDMISVYDGHRSNVGRAVVDSTWHHWFDMNVDNLKAAGGNNWDKIGQYFLNVARYLAPPGKFRERCLLDIIDAQFDYPFNEEQLWTGISDDSLEVGSIFGETLKRRWGPCGVLRFTKLTICRIKPWLCKLLEEEILPDIDPQLPPKLGPICLTCPPFEVLSRMVLGEIVHATTPIREQLQARFKGEKCDDAFTIDELDKLVLQGVESGVKKFQQRVGDDLERVQKHWLRSK